MTSDRARVSPRRRVGWAAAISGDGPPALAARIVRLAVAGAATPDLVRDAVAARLDRGDAAAPGDVLADCERAVAVAGRTPDARTFATVGERLAACGARVLVADRPGYPSRLASAWPDLGAPLWLFARGPSRGNLSDLPDGPAVAVVGTRRPTLDGARTARALGRLLGDHGVVVVSGMARGIDQAAHRGALDAGGATIGVLGAGFDVDYPRGSAALRDAVADAGGLVTEHVPGVPPRPPHFLWRNRIIAGLADATVVVEGRVRSGALQTARLAAAQGRDVLAVPGPLSAPASRAPLDLIRDGAQPVTRLTDVLEVVGVPPSTDPRGGPDASVPRGLDPVAAAVLERLGSVPARPGALATATGHHVGAVLAAVADLEGRGLAATTASGVVAIAP